MSKTVSSRSRRAPASNARAARFYLRDRAAGALESRGWWSRRAGARAVRVIFRDWVLERGRVGGIGRSARENKISVPAAPSGPPPGPVGNSPTARRTREIAARSHLGNMAHQLTPMAAVASRTRSWAVLFGCTTRKTVSSVWSHQTSIPESTQILRGPK